ncbi:DUF6507 family protein [Nocardiopsis sp. NPDC050513]|uniref:DUF6507 family protein n=1 Tax=Nocardiopsis sp. NPDC050513 TaxID=3364338 RepID=UPI0037A4E168
MSSWDIQPAEVAGVLTRVAGHFGEEGGEGLIGAATGLEHCVGRCVEIPASFPIEVAFGEFADFYFGLVGDMAAVTSSALTGAAEATLAYRNGQEDMAAQHQAAAGQVPEPVDYGSDYAAP